MRNPLKLHNVPGGRPYMPTYVENPFAEENPFRTKPRRNIEPWPSFAESRALLPQPYYPARPAAVDCYFRCWQIAFDNFRKATEKNGFVSDYSSTMFADCLFMWDSVFITLFGRYADRVWRFQNTLDNFYVKQHPDGGICRQFLEDDGSECYARFDPAGTGPNILGFSEWEYYLFTRDEQRLAEVFPALVAYGQWFRRYRTWPNGSYWGTGWASGMVNQPRTPAGAHLWYDHAHRTWVDTNLQQVLANRIVLQMADALGRRAEVRDVAAENAALVPWINEHLWDEGTGFYHDLERDQSRITAVKTIGAYWALLADAVPPARLARFVSHLENPSEFARKHCVPSLSADTAGYDPDGGLWLGGVWAPTNYMVLSGLLRHGYVDLAYRLASNHFQNVMNCYERTGSLFEHFAPDQSAQGRGRKDFVGWTGITPIAMFFEFILGLQPQPAQQRLVWNLWNTDELGVDRYPFGQHGSLELRASARASASDRPVVSIKSNVPLTLELVWQGGRETRRVMPDDRSSP
ncbi:MAG TPA: trehalase family glycosidase [Polyangiaceae bacterium]|nr:trehalase family glycosidase [Polyangiaceae bacterium]